MNGFTVQLEALGRLAHAFRGVVAIGIPPIDPLRTGHPELDDALDDLRAAVDALIAGVDRAASSQGTHIESASAGYLEADGALNHRDRFR